MRQLPFPGQALGSIVFSHANGFPAGTYRVLFESWRAAGWRVLALPRIGHDPNYPVSGNWPHLRDELLASMMTAALQKLEPTKAFPDEAAKLIAEVERKELGRTERADWYKRFCYVQEGDHYFDLQDRREVSRATFNAL